ncbi:MAG: FAD-dependent oxidoreductase [Steroidobacteraceae bacterium]
MRRREFLGSGVPAALVAAAWSRKAFCTSVAPKVVIGGGGFAGACCALRLRRLNPTIQVTLVDPNPSYVTCPMSNEVLVDLRGMASITISRTGLMRAGVRYLHDRIDGVDTDKRIVRLRGGSALAYDKLVIAPGIRLLYGTPEGYDEAAALRMPHAWIAGAQTQLLAAQLHSISDGGTVAISVPTGLMRCPPGPYERASLIAHWLQARKPRSKVLIFDANNHFPRQDVFTASWAQRYPGMIEWIPPGQGGAVTRVDVRTDTLYSPTGAHRVAVANVIPPQAPGTLALDTGLAAGHGWCPVSPVSFESELISHIHVVGDACIAGPMPKAASAAHSQALRCATAIAAGFAGREALPGELESVCYSMLAPEAALAMHGHFKVEDGEIRQIESGVSQTHDQTPAAQYAREATAWYGQIRSECFGS